MVRGRARSEVEVDATIGDVIARASAVVATGVNISGTSVLAGTSEFETESRVEAVTKENCLAFEMGLDCTGLANAGVHTPRSKLEQPSISQRIIVGQTKRPFMGNDHGASKTDFMSLG